MGGFLSEIGKKLAERWGSLLVLPGALYLAVVAVAVTLGHGHALDLPYLVREITRAVKNPVAVTAGGQIALLAAVLAGASVVGLLAQVLSSLVERLHLAAAWDAWPPPLRQVAAALTARRRRRWTERADRYQALRRGDAEALRRHGTRPDPAPRRAAHRAMRRVAAEYPHRPTWSGDRLHAVSVRLDRDHHLDVAVLWPHLWLVLPDGARADITAARQDLTRATALGAWALLYLPLAAWWWPAAPLAVALAAIGHRRTRAATDTYATLLEAAVRVHTVGLAQQVGLEQTGPLTQDTGDALVRLLDSPPPPPR